MAIQAKQLNPDATTLVRVVRGGQITLPADIRKALMVEEGNYLKAEVVDNRLVLKPVTIMPREQAWQQIREAQASAEPTAEQAGKSVEAQEQEIVEIVEERRHRQGS